MEMINEPSYRKLDNPCEESVAKGETGYKPTRNRLWSHLEQTWWKKDFTSTPVTHTCQETHGDAK
jgi:hypothetical protein